MAFAEELLQQHFVAAAQQLLALCAGGTQNGLSRKVRLAGIMFCTASTFPVCCLHTDCDQHLKQTCATQLQWERPQGEPYEGMKSQDGCTHGTVIFQIFQTALQVAVHSLVSRMHAVTSGVHSLLPDFCPPSGSPATSDGGNRLVVNGQVFPHCIVLLIPDTARQICCKVLSSYNINML